MHQLVAAMWLSTRKVTFRWPQRRARRWKLPSAPRRHPAARSRRPGWRAPPSRPTTPRPVDHHRRSLERYEQKTSERCGQCAPRFSVSVQRLTRGAPVRPRRAEDQYGPRPREGHVAVSEGAITHGETASAHLTSPRRGQCRPCHLHERRAARGASEQIPRSCALHAGIIQLEARVLPGCAPIAPREEAGGKPLPEALDAANATRCRPIRRASSRDRSTPVADERLRRADQPPSACAYMTRTCVSSLMRTT